MNKQRDPSRRQFVKGVGGAVAGVSIVGLRAANEPDAKPRAAAAGRVAPVLEVPRIQSMRVDGALGRRAEANVRHWLLVADRANPAMLQIFRDRDRKPPRDLVPWAGEFAGKYLISAVQALRLCKGTATDADLRRHVGRFVDALVARNPPTATSARSPPPRG